MSKSFRSGWSQVSMPAERMRRGSLAGLRIAPFKASSFDAIHRVMVAEPSSKAARPRFQERGAARRFRLIPVSLIILEPSR